MGGPNCSRFIAITLTLFLSIKQTKAVDEDGEASQCKSLDFTKSISYGISFPLRNTFLSSNRYGGKCADEPKCICVGNYDEIAMHCEGILEAKLDYFLSSRQNVTNLKVNCNGTLEFNISQKEFYRNLRLNVSYTLETEFVDCPEPTETYASLLRPRNDQNGSLNHQKIPVIEDLWIKCFRRKNLTVARKHFLGLQQLNALRIECKGLSELPEDMFDEMTNVETIEITNSSIEHLSKRIFSKLRNLLRLSLENNRIRTVSKEILESQIALKHLNMRNNLVSFLDDDAFEETKNITEMILSNNRLNRLPKSLAKLRNLYLLNIEDNLLNEIEVEVCRQLKATERPKNSTDINSNQPTTCFPPWRRAMIIDLSGNRISKLPNTVSKVNFLKHFRMSRNTGKLRRLHKFFTSSNLWTLRISNSQIEYVDFDFFSGFPELRRVNMSFNKLTSLPKELFSHNPNLADVDFHNNQLISLPRELFINNSRLEDVDLSSNRITNMESDLFSDKIHLRILDLSKNQILQLSGDILVSQNIKRFDVSFNNMSKLDSSLLSNCCSALQYLDMSNNKLESIEKDIFKNLGNLETLNISENKITSIEGELLEDLDLLTILDVSENLLLDFPFQTILPYDGLMSKDPITRNSFDINGNLKEINLNGNRLNFINVTSLKNVERLSLSRNNLTEVILPPLSNLNNLTLSHNKINSVVLSGASTVNPMDLDLSNNNMSFCDTTISFHMFVIERDNFFLGYYCPYNSIDFSNNNIDFDNSPSIIDSNNMLWGKTTQLSRCDQVTVFNYSNNLIKDVLLDWRDDPSLVFVDVRNNKIRFLHEQDILFDNSKFKERTCRFETDDQLLQCKRNMTLDLRNNEIHGVELPSQNLVIVPSSCNRTMNHSHATILLDNNPFYCGFGLFNFLRYVEEDVTIVSEVMRTTGEKKALPAKIIPGNLTCSEPELVRGKKVMETETYLHHLMPMVGLCALTGCVEQQEDDDK